MRHLYLAPFLVMAFAVPALADDKSDMLGKWELTEAAAGMPKGTIWDFQKDGALVVSVKDKSVNFKWELKEKVLHLDINGEKDTTGLVKVDKEQLVLKDNDGTTATFKRTK